MDIYDGCGIMDKSKIMEYDGYFKLVKDILDAYEVNKEENKRLVSKPEFIKNEILRIKININRSKNGLEITNMRKELGKLERKLKEVNKQSE